MSAVHSALEYDPHGPGLCFDSECRRCDLRTDLISQTQELTDIGRLKISLFRHLCRRSKHAKQVTQAEQWLRDIDMHTAEAASGNLDSATQQWIEEMAFERKREAENLKRCQLALDVQSNGSVRVSNEIKALLRAQHVEDFHRKTGDLLAAREKSTLSDPDLEFERIHFAFTAQAKAEAVKQPEELLNGFPLHRIDITGQKKKMDNEAGDQEDEYDGADKESFDEEHELTLKSFVQCIPCALFDTDEERKSSETLQNFLSSSVHKRNEDKDKVEPVHKKSPVVPKLSMRKLKRKNPVESLNIRLRHPRNRAKP
jgi:hypothetical protein